jgi:uncharacterized protein YbjT (DUF2867 family)
VSGAPHDLLVFGAGGKTGVWLVRLARARGLRVAAVLRPGRDDGELAPLASRVLRGDAFVPGDCARAIADAQPAAVVSLLGGRDARGRRVDALGNINVIDGARAWRPDTRLLLLTSMGCDEQFALMPPPLQRMLGEALHAKTEAERYLRASGLRWTILRPGGLTDLPGLGRYHLTPGVPSDTDAYVPRQDVALAALDLLADPASMQQALTLSG